MKLALIIGGSGGIGLETAKVLLDKKFDVCLTYYNDKDKIEKSGIKVSALYRMDMKDENSIKDSINEILNKHKKIDVIIYCVSSQLLMKKIQNLAWEDFQEHINIQIKGLFTVIKVLSPLIEKKHKIKFITVLSEVCIGNPPSMMSHYTTSKYGLMGFVKSMASELVNNNCTFNMVSPGMVNTNLISNFPPKLIEIAAYNNPMKRIAEPIDVAKVILFLASDDSDYLNGVNIPINGGNVFI